MDYLITRFLCAVLTGVILSQTGSLIQMATRNILASPSTLGFDGLAILWLLLLHSFLIMTGTDESGAFIFIYGVPVFILVGWLFSKFMTTNHNVEKLIFIGLTFNLLVGTIFSLWQFLFLAFNLPFPVELWFGHFRYSEASILIILGVVEFLILAGWLSLKNEFLIYSLGQGISQNLNLRKNILFIYIFIAIAVGTFAVVSLFGAFSFLGLLFPIIARKLWFKKFDLHGEFILGGFLNGIFLMLIDSLCYFFPIYGAEIPVGLIATGVGALSLILLLWKSESRLKMIGYWQR